MSRIWVNRGKGDSLHSYIPKVWDRPAILAEIRRRGSNLARIAEAAGLKRTSLSWAMKNPRPRPCRAIAEFLGEPLDELWPNWFDKNGKLISTRPLDEPGPRADSITRGARPARARIYRRRAV